MSFDAVDRYVAQEVCSFRKTKEVFGELSNMAAGFPIRVLCTRILTVEALYQACRFPHLPEVQAMIIAEKSPMSAKMKSKPHRAATREDWHEVRIEIMRWCLNLKFAFHFRRFGRLIETTSGCAIVENSHSDDFWGAVRSADDPNVLVGRNVLGKLLVELRERYLAGAHEELLWVKKPAIGNFRLLGAAIEDVDFRYKIYVNVA